MGPIRNSCPKGYHSRACCVGDLQSVGRKADDEAYVGIEGVNSDKISRNFSANVDVASAPWYS